MTGAVGEFAQGPQRPGVWETLGAAIRVMREHPAGVMLPFAIAQVFLIIKSLVTGATTPDGEQLPFAVELVVGFASGLVGAIGTGATILIVGALRRDKLLGLSDAFNGVFQRLLPLFALSAILWVLLTLPLAFATREASDRVWIILIVLVWLVPVVYLLLRLGVSNEVLLLEGKGPVEALRRSWRLLEGYLLRLLGIVAVHTVAAVGVSVGVFYGATAVGVPGAGVTVATEVLTIPFAVFGVIASTLYYLRIRELEPGADEATAMQGSLA